MQKLSDCSAIFGSEGDLVLATTSTRAKRVFVSSLQAETSFQSWIEEEPLIPLIHGKVEKISTPSINVINMKKVLMVNQHKDGYMLQFDNYEYMAGNNSVNEGMSSEGGMEMSSQGGTQSASKGGTQSASKGGTEMASEEENIRFDKPKEEFTNFCTSYEVFRNHTMNISHFSDVVNDVKLNSNKSSSFDFLKQYLDGGIDKLRRLIGLGLKERRFAHLWLNNQPGTLNWNDATLTKLFHGLEAFMNSDVEYLIRNLPVLPNFNPGVITMTKRAVHLLFLAGIIPMLVTQNWDGNSGTLPSVLGKMVSVRQVPFFYEMSWYRKYNCLMSHPIKIEKVRIYLETFDMNAPYAMHLLSMVQLVMDYDEVKNKEMMDHFPSLLRGEVSINPNYYIGDNREELQIDFANAKFGGGVRGSGHVQEEAMLTELGADGIVASVLMNEAGPFGVSLLIGGRRYSRQEINKPVYPNNIHAPFREIVINNLVYGFEPSIIAAIDYPTQGGKLKLGSRHQPLSVFNRQDYPSRSQLYVRGLIEPSNVPVPNKWYQLSGTNLIIKCGMAILAYEQFRQRLGCEPKLIDTGALGAGAFGGFRAITGLMQLLGFSMGCKATGTKIRLNYLDSAHQMTKFKKLVDGLRAKGIGDLAKALQSYGSLPPVPLVVPKSRSGMSTVTQVEVDRNQDAFYDHMFTRLGISPT